jgi:hypothetical protein
MAGSEAYKSENTVSRDATGSLHCWSRCWFCAASRGVDISEGELAVPARPSFVAVWAFGDV